MQNSFFIPKDIIYTDRGKGFQMTFENGNTISVMFGTGNYCSNKAGIVTAGGNGSNSAEIAIWNSEGKEYDFGEGHAKGWVNTDETAKWIHFAANNIF